MAELRKNVKVCYKTVNGECRPPVFPRPDGHTRNTNKLQFLYRNVLHELMRQKNAWPFLKPVNAKKLAIPDYHQVIKQPMDFETIKLRLENNYYFAAEQCLYDFNLVFTNCYLYNSHDEEIVMLAQHLERFFRTLLKDMPSVEEVVKSDNASID